MTQVTLNAALMMQIFQVVASQSSQGSYAIVQPEAPEVKDLIARKYIKTNKKLHNSAEGVGAVIVTGATEEDLKADLGMTDGAPLAAPTAPAAAPTVPSAPSAPTAPFAVDTAAPQADDDVPQVLASADDAAVIDASEGAAAAPALLSGADATVAQPEEFVPAPSVQDTTAAILTGSGDTPAALAEVEQEGNIKKIGGGEVETVATAQTRNGEVAITTGIAFVVKEPKRKKSDGTGRETHPYKTIAEFKLANPTQVPSFHIAGRKVKDISNSVNTHSDKYEVSHGITFRAQAVDGSDPEGEGVRVFALFPAEAPARRTSKKTTATTTQQ